jgi:hypothetical protein
MFLGWLSPNDLLQDFLTSRVTILVAGAGGTPLVKSSLGGTCTRRLHLFAVNERFAVMRFEKAEQIK